MDWYERADTAHRLRPTIRATFPKHLARLIENELVTAAELTWLCDDARFRALVQEIRDEHARQEAAA